MGLDWKKLGQKVVDTAVTANKNMSRDMERQMKEIEKSAIKKSNGKLSNEAMEKLDDMYNKIYDYQDSAEEFEYKYHSKYRSHDDM